MLWGKNINVYINSAQRSPSLYTKWLSMKNELCISSLTKKKPQNLVVSDHRLYNNCLEQLLLHILSLSEKWGASPGQCIGKCHLSSELHSSISYSYLHLYDRHSNNSHRESRAAEQSESNAQVALWAGDPQVHLHLYKLCYKPTAHSANKLQ